MRRIDDSIILDAAFELYKNNKIENVPIEEVANKAGVGTTTMYRKYKTKLGLSASVCAYKWKEYFIQIFEGRSEEELKNADAIDRLEFTLDIYIDLYKNHKDLIRFNDDFNHFLHDNKNVGKLELNEYPHTFDGVTGRFHNIYERAKVDGTIRTDITEKELLRVLLHTMMGACSHYAGGFSFGASDSEDYCRELTILKEILMNYAAGH